MPILNSINQMLGEMTEWRHDLHKIPEIGLEEYKTSKYIKNKLNEFKINFKDGYSNTGIVAWVDGNKVGYHSFALAYDLGSLKHLEKYL